MMSNPIISWGYGASGILAWIAVNRSAGAALLDSGGTAQAPGRPALVYTY